MMQNNNPPPAETPTQTASENTKTAYDFGFDMEVIKADCISIGQSMGLRLDTSLTPSNASWWNPVTASRSNQGEALKQSLESYIKFHTAENLSAYGIDEISDFNIYCEAKGKNGQPEPEITTPEENRKAADVWQGQKGVPLLLHSSNGIDLCCGNIRDRFCGE